MPSNEEQSASGIITDYIAELGDWRGSRLAQLRKVILKADPELTEEWKWGTPVWSRQGNVLAVGAFKGYLKINFFKGASLEDPDGLFNAGLDAKTMRSIDIRENDRLDEQALMRLVRSAVAYNTAGKKK
jgi:hypothetical protein